MTTKKYPANYWTKEKVISYIKELHKKGESLRSWDIRNNHTSLYHVSYKLFNNWQKAVESAGINYKILLKNPWKYNEDIIKKRLVELHDKKVDLSDSGLRKYDEKFYSAVTKHVGSVGNALTDCGIDPHLYYKQKPTGYWTKDRVLAEAKKLKERGEDLSSQNVRTKYSKLWNICMKRFGGWINILREIGINPTESSRLYANTKEFKDDLKEKLTREVLIDLYFVRKNSLIEIGEMFGCGYKPVQRLMKEYELERRAGFFGRKKGRVSKDGHKVFSSYELKVDNFLFEQNIPHQYDSKYHKSGSRDFRTDFLLPDDVYVEVKGLSGIKEYEKKFKEKMSWISNRFLKETGKSSVTIFDIKPDKNGKLTKEMIEKQLQQLIGHLNRKKRKDL